MLNLLKAMDGGYTVVVPLKEEYVCKDESENSCRREMDEKWEVKWGEKEGKCDSIHPPHTMQLHSRYCELWEDGYVFSTAQKDLYQDVREMECSREP